VRFEKRKYNIASFEEMMEGSKDDGKTNEHEQGMDTLRLFEATIRCCQNDNIK